MKKRLILFILIVLGSGFFLQFQAAALTGDANSDGKVDIIDAMVVAQYYVGLYETLPDRVAADVNCSGDATIVDALMIARYYVGLLTSLPGCAEVYPTALLALPAETVAELQAEFDALNNNAVYGTVGKYGLLTSHSIPYGEAPSGNPLTDEARVLQLAREALLKNSHFTNVNAATPLDDYRVIHATANSNWIIEFRFDYYRNIPTLFSFISVEVNREVYCIEYHYYPDNIYLPGDINITPQQAQEQVLGEVLVYYDVAGTRRELIVTEDALTVTPSVKAVIPCETSDSLEYRYCWQVWIAEGMWYIYVDVMTGAISGTEQNFQT